MNTTFYPILKDEKIRNMISESWAVSWPMTLIMFYEFLIGLSDVYVAGRFGKEVQAAYGLAFQLYFVFIIIGMALGVGTVSITSRLFTSDKNNEFGIAINSSFAVSFITGAAFGILGFTLSGIIINSLHVSEQVKQFSIPFLKIYSIAFLFDYILLNTNGILRASKMIKKSMYTMSIVCLMNISLNFILAFYTPLKSKGIAVATVISLFTGSIINMSYLKRLMGQTLKFSMNIIKTIIKISWPSGLLQVLWQVGAIALFLILTYLPKNNIEIIAAFTNGLKIESAIFLPAFAFNMANAVIVGNLLGGKREEDAFRGGIVTAVMGVIVVTILSIIVIFNARYILCFLSNDSVVINEGARYIYISLIFEPFMAWGVILGGGLNGAGDTKSIMKIIALSIWLVRIPLSYFLAIFFGFGAVMVWWSMNASILVQSVFVTKRYFSKKWIKLAETAI